MAQPTASPVSPDPRIAAVWNPLDRSIIYVEEDELPPRGNSVWWSWFFVALAGLGLIVVGVVCGPSSSLTR